MIKWPMKMWLWGKDGIFVASNRPPDPGDDLIAISVYPADQVPEPVAWMFPRRYGSGLSFAKPPEMLDDDGNVIEPVPLGRIAPPATIRQDTTAQQERKRIAASLMERALENIWGLGGDEWDGKDCAEHAKAALDTAIRALTDEQDALKRALLRSAIPATILQKEPIIMGIDYAIDYLAKVRQQERERCAKVCEREAEKGSHYDQYHYISCAKAIRALEDES